MPTRILTIDADAGVRAEIGAALAASTLDYTLVEAADAEAGLTAAAQDAFDCVLLDSRLPGVAWADYAARLTAGGPVIIALTADANQTAEALRAGAVDAVDRGEVAAAVVRAIRYATARRGLIHELQAAREIAEDKTRALDALNRQTTIILSIIAHDLRNPFQVLIGMSELLVASAGASDPAATAKRAAVVFEAANQAHGLLESLFAWASLHMDARTEPRPAAVATLFQDCAIALRERANTKGVQLDVVHSDLRIETQEGPVAAILRNLVGNALKFTDAGGRVTLSAEARDGAVALCVADTGVGMSETQTARLFQLGDRASSAGTGGEGGAGLGLLLCRELAVWIGGQLEVESRLGEGATFKLVLPVAG